MLPHMRQSVLLDGKMKVYVHAYFDFLYKPVSNRDLFPQRFEKYCLDDFSFFKQCYDVYHVNQ